MLYEKLLAGNGRNPLLGNRGISVGGLQVPHGHVLLLLYWVPTYGAGGRRSASGKNCCQRSSGCAGAPLDFPTRVFNDVVRARPVFRREAAVGRRFFYAFLRLSRRLFLLHSACAAPVDDSLGLLPGGFLLSSA